ncbi:hypothetical protein H4R33_002026 [Dimargaris cristalligena]|uniref:F-box domain-containing protein n=1 Tax=Dimargaris cristalligena TaxID=215637 RepID=A0A4Q0A3D3_9FUNG|nr:hypothetical protein H4R33_002026 [Dimargaris cristalligena]RKP40101.1 hypothetical protein BJ085DRAFT_34310 [Dimargaris cristalligena]|eukprot:RKP40101.1 hypothetical protein BJ085DRAFT_34310 [Dimargaris cristalligena]
MSHDPPTLHQVLPLWQFFNQPWSKITSLTLSCSSPPDGDMLPEISSSIVANFPEPRDLSLLSFATPASTYSSILSQCSKLESLMVEECVSTTFNELRQLDFYNANLSLLSLDGPICDWESLATVISRLPNLQGLHGDMVPVPLRPQFRMQYPHIQPT